MPTLAASRSKTQVLSLKTEGPRPPRRQ